MIRQSQIAEAYERIDPCRLREKHDLESLVDSSLASNPGLSITASIARSLGGGWLVNVTGCFGQVDGRRKKTLRVVVSPHPHIIWQDAEREEEGEGNKCRGNDRPYIARIHNELLSNVVL